MGPILDSIGAISEKAEELLNNLAAVSSPATPIHEASAEEVQTHRALHVR